MFDDFFEKICKPFVEKEKVPSTVINLTEEKKEWDCVIPPIPEHLKHNPEIIKRLKETPINFDRGNWMEGLFPKDKK